jgi:hypothetical protein
MSTIDQDIFLEQEAKSDILERVTRYCNLCYKEFSSGEFIYYDTQTCNYLCSDCACCKTQELQEINECDTLECQNDGGLF